MEPLWARIYLTEVDGKPWVKLDIGPFGSVDEAAEHAREIIADAQNEGFETLDMAKVN